MPKTNQEPQKNTDDCVDLCNINNTKFIENSQKQKDLVQWNKRYTLGIEQIDTQHQKLISLCNFLHKSVLISDRNIQKQNLIKVLKDCVDYVKTHFALEEKLMLQSGFLGYSEHKKAHNEFSQTILKTARDLETKNYTNALKFVMFLHDWILQHISYEDKKFAPCVKAYLKNNPS